MDFQAKVDNEGKLILANRNNFNSYIQQLKGVDVVLTIERRIRKRSNPQNAYYWSCVIPIVKEAFRNLGHDLTKEQTHEFLKNRFLKEEMVSPDGELIGDRIKSTTELQTFEFNEYTEKIQQFGAEVLGIYIPDPNEQITTLI